MVFEIYTQQRLSINAIARLLNQRGIATRTGKGRWERSTVWGMLRNPAYRGTACYGKTEQRPRQRVTRPLRQRKAFPSRDVGGHERPRAEWIEVPVPALVSEEMFALAQEQLEKNKRHSPRRTVEPTLLQGMLVCEQCGYALYRTATHTSKQKLNYYRCLGSDGYRRLNGPVCTNRPIRQDYLDEFVWSEIIRLLDDPRLIQSEIDRRREAAQNADPLRKREEELRREQVRVEKSSERLVTAYQEGLLTLAQLRQRMPALQKQTQVVLEQWTDQWRQPARGEITIVRYADDAILGFEHQDEAERYLRELKEHLREYGLELNEDKTRLIRFGRFAAFNRAERGEGKPE